MQDELEKEREKVKTTFFLFPFSLRDTANADRPGSMGGDEREDLYGDCVRTYAVRIVGDILPCTGICAWICTEDGDSHGIGGNNLAICVRASVWAGDISELFIKSSFLRENIIHMMHCMWT